MDMERPAADEIAAQRITLQRAQESFLLRCRAQNLSPLTIDWYTRLLKGLERFLNAKGVSVVREVTPNLIRSHLDDLRATGHKSGTVFRRFGALRCFFGFLARERLLPSSPMTVLEKPKKERRFIAALNLDQVRLLLAQPNLQTFAGLRCWTMMVLILDSGLRISEVLGLRKDRVDYKANTVRVIGKGDREREVPFGSVTKNALWQYQARVGELPGQDLLFTDQFGRALTRSWVEDQVRTYGRTANIQGVRVSPHTLRHTMALTYILNGGDAFSLQKILGHSTLDMVRLYVSMADRDVALQHRKFSPIDHLGVVPGQRRQVLVR